MADQSENIVLLPGCGPWAVGQRISVAHVEAVAAADRYASQFVATVQDCIGLGRGRTTPFVASLGRFVGRVALVVADTSVFPPGATLYWRLGAGWSNCCASRVAFGRYVVPVDPPPCVELVQVDGLAHQSIELRAGMGPGDEPARVSWRLMLIECCGGAREVIGGQGVELNVEPPA